jgi:DNA-binding PadR family transcriptional regulator
MDLELSEVPQSTLDLIVLKALESIGPLHRYAIRLRIEQMSAKRVQMNEGTVYAVLMRLKQKGWITAHEHALEQTRTRFYSITPAGRRQLVRETDNWQRTVAVVTLVLQLTPLAEKRASSADADRRSPVDATASMS